MVNLKEMNGVFPPQMIEFVRELAELGVNSYNLIEPLKKLQILTW